MNLGMSSKKHHNSTGGAIHYHLLCLWLGDVKKGFATLYVPLQKKQITLLRVIPTMTCWVEVVR